MLNEFGLSNMGSRKWSDIIKTLLDEDLIGPYLDLTCGRHPENDIVVREPKDFDKRPEGGCSKPCDFRLACGHVCKLFCHIFDQEHQNIKCKKLFEIKWNPQRKKLTKKSIIIFTFKS